MMYLTFEVDLSASLEFPDSARNADWVDERYGLGSARLNKA